MNKSIKGMNWIVGQRELESGQALTELEQIRVQYETSQMLQGGKQDDTNKMFGANMEASALHRLIEYVNTDPAHILNAEAYPDELSNLDTADLTDMAYGCLDLEGTDTSWASQLRDAGFGEDGRL